VRRSITLPSKSRAACTWATCPISRQRRRFTTFSTARARSSASSWVSTSSKRRRAASVSSSTPPPHSCPSVLALSRASLCRKLLCFPFSAWSGSQPGPSVAAKVKIFFVTAICVAFVHSACDSLKCHEPLVIPFNTNHIVPRRRAVVRSGVSISCTFARADTTQPRTQRQVSGISTA